MLYDLKKIISELNSLPKFDSQICLQGITPDSDPFSGIGKSNNLKGGDENKFIYKLFDLPYINNIIDELKLFRTRVLKLRPKTCYTFHRDYTPRIHIPVITNPKCFMVLETKVEWYPADGNYYKIDTTRYHTFVNASLEERIHIVGCYYEEKY
jgi:hypothetical protein